MRDRVAKSAIAKRTSPIDERRGACGIRALASCWILLLLVLASACGQTVRPLSIHDPRLPLEARRWLADAEDAVTVTEAWRDAARESLHQSREWHQRSVLSVRWPATSEAEQARVALEEMAQARMGLAQLQLVLAEAEHSLAQIRRTQVNAETAVRYDLRYYELDPFLDGTKEARGAVERSARAVSEQRLAVEEATTRWWKAYQSYVTAGGDPRVLWTITRASLADSR